MNNINYNAKLLKVRAIYQYIPLRFRKVMQQVTADLFKFANVTLKENLHYLNSVILLKWTK